MSEELADFLKTPLGPFRPDPYYEPHTDSMIYYSRDVPSYAKPIDAHMTLFLSQADDSVVGCEISGCKPPESD